MGTKPKIAATKEEVEALVKKRGSMRAAADELGCTLDAIRYALGRRRRSLDKRPRRFFFDEDGKKVWLSGTRRNAVKREADNMVDTELPADIAAVQELARQATVERKRTERVFDIRDIRTVPVMDKLGRPMGIARGTLEFVAPDVWDHGTIERLIAAAARMALEEK